MIQALLPGAIAFTMLTSQIAPAPLVSSPSYHAPQSGQKKLIGIVKKDDTLKSLAKKYYGKEEFWATLWNDNQQISDPNRVETGTLLTLKQVLPQEPEEPSEKIKELYSSFFPKPTPSVVTIVIQPASVSATTTPEVSPASPSVAAQPASPQVLTEEQITYLGNCEAGMNPTKNSGNGYYGAFQFSYGTWSRMETSYARADLAPIEVQKDAVQRLLSRSSIFTQFPACAKAMQAAGLL